MAVWKFTYKQILYNSVETLIRAQSLQRVNLGFRKNNPCRFEIFVFEKRNFRVFRYFRIFSQLPLRSNTNDKISQFR